MLRLVLTLLVTIVLCTGCASRMRAATPRPALAEVVASDESPTGFVSSTLREVRVTSARPQGTPVVSVAQAAAPDDSEPVVDQAPELEPYDPAEAFDATEEIPAPAPSEISPFKARVEDEANLDRFNRDILDVEVDIRPTAGAMPEDRGADRFANQPVIDETLPSGEPADVLCAYTPWTICYRPLYFEDIGLERYGKNVGYLQTGLSGVRFFGSIAALPYKMTRRPPRSCECSNGFSRPGDCPLPGYGNRRLELDAALIEAAAITAVVYIIP